jgi:hypothetical protein
MFGQLKQNLAMGTLVRLGQTGGSMDGLTGRIAGVTTETAQADFYIVLMIDRIPGMNPAITIIESCIEPI